MRGLRERKEALLKLSRRSLHPKKQRRRTKMLKRNVLKLPLLKIFLSKKSFQKSISLES